jgi:DNA polymerase I-like protein with 3'-5' exonuclease and polymerase domains
MGQAKLCKALGLPTEWVKYKGRKIEVAGAQGKALLERYYEYMPWIKQLDATCKDTLLRRGNVRTIGNRLLKKEEDHLAYKALNKLIQGSAADQCLMVLKAAFDAGVDIKCVVHDEFNIEGTIVDACFMKDLMENTLKLHVPMVAEVKSGNSWGDLHKVEVKNEKDRAA